MGNIVKYAAVNTKIRSLEGKFLKKDQYIKLLKCKTFSDAVQYLKNETYYGNVISNFNKKEIHREDLEVILKRDYINKFDKISHYFNGPYKKIIKIFFMRFEIEDLKAILRAKYINKSNEKLRNFLMARGRLNSLNYDKLISAKSVEEVINRLQGTVYYKHIAPLAKHLKEDGLFRIETTLDFVYFSLMRKNIPKLNKEDRQILEKVIGTESDLLNIQWIFRGKFYYNLNPEQLLIYTIYNGYKVNREKLKALCYAKTESEFYDILDDLPYKEVFTRDENSEYLVERQMMVYLRKMFNSINKEGKLNISLTVAYFELQLLEVRDIISIIENIRYSVDIKEASKYVTVNVNAN